MRKTVCSLHIYLGFSLFRPLHWLMKLFALLASKPHKMHKYVFLLNCSMGLTKKKPFSVSQRYRFVRCKSDMLYSLFRFFQTKLGILTKSFGKDYLNLVLLNSPTYLWIGSYEIMEIFWFSSHGTLREERNLPEF